MQPMPQKCSTLSREQLLRVAKELKLPHASSLKKAELCALVEQSRAKHLEKMVALAAMGVGSVSLVGATAALRRRIFDVAPCAQRVVAPPANLSRLALGESAATAHVIVGGGPVGMFLALQLINISPWAMNWKRGGGASGVIILEKRGETSFSRRQVVVVTRKSINQLSHEAQQRILASACEVLPPAYTTSARCNIPSDSSYVGKSLISIKLSDLEKALYDECKRNAEFITLINNVSDIQFFPRERRLHFRQSSNVVKYEITYNTLTGADGARSVVRDHALGLPLRSGISDQQQQYGIVIMFDDEKHVAGEDRGAEIRTVAQHNSRAFWTREGMAYIGLRVSAEYGRAVERELNLLPTTSAITSWSDIVAMPAVSSVLRYTKTTVCEYLDPKCPSTFKHFSIAAFPLHVCRVDLRSNSADRPPMFIVGDAVFQTHFFSGTGLLAGFDMADAIASDLDEIAVAEKNAERKQRLTKRVHRKIQAIVDQYVAEVEVIARTKPMDMVK